MLESIPADFIKKVQAEIDIEIERRGLWLFSDDKDTDMEGYVITGKFWGDNLEDFYVDIFNEECLIVGYVLMNYALYGYQSTTNEFSSAAYPNGSEKYCGYREAKIQLRFSFYYDKKEVPRNFELDFYDIEEVVEPKIAVDFNPEGW